MESEEMYYIPQVSQMPSELHPTNWVEKSTEFTKNGIKTHIVDVVFELIILTLHLLYQHYGTKFTDLPICPCQMCPKY